MDEARRRTLHGRRRGKKLRAGQQSLLDTLLPRLLLALPPDAARKIDLAQAFGGTLPPTASGSRSASARASISSGRPSSIRDVGLIGCEPYHQRRRQVPRAYRAHGREQCAAVHRRCAPRDGGAAARLAVARLRAVSRSVAQDPPSQAALRAARDPRHPGRPDDPGAELRLATDDPSYLPWMVEHACTHPAFEWLAERPADWRDRPADWPPTRYERKMLAGHKPVFLRLVRR